MILQGKIAGTVVAIAGTALLALAAALAWQTWQLKLCRSGAEDDRAALAVMRGINSANAAEIERLLDIRDANRETYQAAIDAVRRVAEERQEEYRRARAETRRLETELQDALDQDPTGCDDEPAPDGANRLLLDAGDALPRDRSGPRPTNGTGPESDPAG